MIEEGLRSVLVTNVTLVGGRVFPTIRAQGSPYPSVVYQLISDPARYALDGPTGLVEARFQINSYGLTYGAMKAVARQVRAALDGFVGTMGGLPVSLVKYEGGSDRYDQDGDLDGVHAHRADVMIQYREDEP